MADTKISDLGAIPALAGADVLPIVDDTDTTTKNVSITQLDGRYVTLSTAPVTVAGTTDTLAATDNGKVNVYSNASAVTVTIPTDASDDLADGFECLLLAAGAGGLSLDTTGITLIGDSPSTTAAQDQSIYVKKTSTANTWIVIGPSAAGSGTVDTSGTPVANDIARFTDADTIEGRSYSELRSDLRVAPATVAGTTDTLAAGDDSTVILYTAAGAVTVDLDNISTGFEAVLVCLGAGGLTVDANGMSFANSFTPNLTVAQGEALFVKQTAASTWIVLGGTAA